MRKENFSNAVAAHKRARVWGDVMETADAAAAAAAADAAASTAADAAGCFVMD